MNKYLKEELDKILERTHSGDVMLGEQQISEIVDVVLEKEFFARVDHGKEFRKHLTDCNAEKFRIETQEGMVAIRSESRQRKEHIARLEDMLEEIRIKVESKQQALWSQYLSTGKEHYSLRSNDVSELLTALEKTGKLFEDPS